jgi:ketosteroid isomerase-like protein
MKIVVAAMAGAIACAGSLPCSAEPSPSALAGAWAAEDQYWAKNLAGDVAAYLAVFDDDFTGWPCVAERPQNKADLNTQGAGLLSVPGVKIRVSLEDKAATGSDDFVVVYYRAREFRRATDGKLEQLVRNFTHTWVKRPGGWKIIGGMCRNDVRAQ